MYALFFRYTSLAGRGLVLVQSHKGCLVACWTNCPSVGHLFECTLVLFRLCGIVLIFVVLFVLCYLLSVRRGTSVEALLMWVISS